MAPPSLSVKPKKAIVKPQVNSLSAYTPLWDANQCWSFITIILIIPPGGNQRSSPELPPGSQCCVAQQTFYGEEEDSGGRARESGAAVQTDEAEAERQKRAGQGCQDLHMMHCYLFHIVLYYLSVYLSFFYRFCYLCWSTIPYWWILY